MAIKVKEIVKNGIRACIVEIDGKKFIFVNVTPHKLRFKDPVTNVEFEVPESGVVINAKPTEKITKKTGSVEFVQTIFEKIPEDERKITELYKTFEKYGRVIVIGSLIAAQAYPSLVFALTPHPNYKRVGNGEKRMNPRKFTVYC